MSLFIALERINKNKGMGRKQKERYTQTTNKTNQPTNQQTNKQTNKQTNQPTNKPTNKPTNQSTNQPTNQQTNKQTNKPNEQTKTNKTPPVFKTNLFCFFHSSSFVVAAGLANLWKQLLLFFKPIKYDGKYVVIQQQQ
jgi:DNA mismatch repair ATPase MutL